MPPSFAEILRDEMDKTRPTEGKAHTRSGSHAPSRSAIGPAENLTDLNVLFFDRPQTRSRAKVRAYQAHAPIPSEQKPVEEAVKAAPLERSVRPWTSLQQLALQQLQRLGAELNECSTDAEIKKAYRKLALRFHPDHNRDSSEVELRGQTEKFLLVQESIDLLLETPEHSQAA